MADTLEKMDNSLIQHGPLNRRIYLMKVAGQDLPGLIFKMDVLAKNEGYTKIFAKVPQQVSRLFTELGYVGEAAIDGFYHGEIDAVFVCKYLDSERQHEPHQAEIDRILKVAAEKAQTPPAAPVDDDMVIRPCVPADAETMAQIYGQVFASYPFPIHDPAYLRETMQTHVQYFCAEQNGTMIAVSSSEMDTEAENVEMTDFATLPACRGKSLAVRLLRRMEQHMRDRGMKTFYTIARAMSAGMNITFARANYRYGGTLINNTNIAGNIESMNVWHKPANEDHKDHRKQGYL